MITAQDRQSGVTTRQLLAAPHGAVFVWCSENTYYPERLARSHLRHDLKVVPKSWLRLSGMAGCGDKVVVDHTLHPDSENRDALDYLSARSLLVHNSEN